MLAVDLTYDLSPNYDMDAYGAWARHSTEILKNQPGVVDFGGHRQVFGTPRVRTSSVWRCVEDWDSFADSPGWHSMEVELRGFASDLVVHFREN